MCVKSRSHRMTDQYASPALKMETLCSPGTVVSGSQGYTFGRSESPDVNSGLIETSHCVCVRVCVCVVALYHLAYPLRRESSGVQAGDPILEENPGGPTSGGKFGTHFR